ncbi:MAG TPA: carboxymuconolactone decarboxylase family protein [Steroidobacteraceae bacterium]|jgi:4-carboxymuconolactone decarboxylase|nr:carboxymuconolactone decarboxylase family protein [Steroidobacteraceae bacterium]
MSGATGRDRLPPIPDEEQTPAQKKSVNAIVSGSRRDVRGPFIPLLRSPALLDRVHPIGEYLRFRSVIPAELRELAILTMARFWQQTYEWHAHAQTALDAGVAQTTLDRLSVDWDGAGLAEDEHTVFEFCRELHRAHAVSDSLYEAAKKLLGEDGVVELCGLCGYYTLLAMVMNVARTPLPSGAQVPFNSP